MAADAPLAGRVAVVTGAAGRLGPVWRRALEEAGATVAGIDLAAGDGIEAADVTDRAAVEAAFAVISGRHGTPSVLVNNAGIDQPPDAAAQRHAIESVPTEAFRGTVDVNLTGTFHATQVFGAMMRDARRGSIVNIGSLYASVAPDPSLYSHLPGDPPFLKPPAYGASKAGVLSLTRYFARLWGPYGVRVNMLSPGGVAGGQDEEFLRRYSSRVPMRRMAEPDDLVAPLLFLSSDASSYVSGHELRVDGGFTA
jgi:NAD(P)-dependent dehydrogenase (short-subunit alcohol dehydrogenase family)